MSYMTGNLQSPRQSKFKEDFSPKEPIVADEDGLYPLNGLIAGPPYHLLDTDGPRPPTEDAGFIRRHRHNLSNISTISNASTVSDASSGSDISSPSNITSEFSQRIISWYGPTQARMRRCGSPASSIYSADSEPSSPVEESSPSWPLPNSTVTRPDDTDFSTDRLLLATERLLLRIAAQEILIVDYELGQQEQRAELAWVTDVSRATQKPAQPPWVFLILSRAQEPVISPSSV
ncbi:unnamed protein product [Clonostachys solani]|uniref:Uncharacterized protein n=1 Tax=Clonostachys solani TaxID=160281 RepID=A0A9N9ZIG3_9HYPO|nr:unnamed protein product [Clonostachys solani]